MAPKHNDLYVYAKYGNVALSFGFTLIFAIGGGAWFGHWLDGRLRTFPIFLVIGILAGTVLAFKSLFDLLTDLQESHVAEREGVSPVYRRAMNLRRLYFRKASVRKGENPNNKRKE